MLVNCRSTTIIHKIIKQRQVFFCFLFSSYKLFEYVCQFLLFIISPSNSKLARAEKSLILFGILNYFIWHVERFKSRSWDMLSNKRHQVYSHFSLLFCFLGTIEKMRFNFVGGAIVLFSKSVQKLRPFKNLFSNVQNFKKIEISGPIA